MRISMSPHGARQDLVETFRCRSKWFQETDRDEESIPEFCELRLLSCRQDFIPRPLNALSGEVIPARAVLDELQKCSWNMSSPTLFPCSQFGKQVAIRTVRRQASLHATSRRGCPTSVRSVWLAFEPFRLEVQSTTFWFLWLVWGVFGLGYRVNLTPGCSQSFAVEEFDEHLSGRGPSFRRFTRHRAEMGKLLRRESDPNDDIIIISVFCFIETSCASNPGHRDE